MSNFAIVILADGNFGGAQRRFINLFFKFRESEDDSWYLITTSKLKKRIGDIFPGRDEKNILTIDTENKVPGKNTVASVNHAGTTGGGLKKALKETILYKYYYFRKTQKQANSRFELIKNLTKKNNIDVLLGLYDAIIPLYPYFNEKTRPGIIFCNMDSWFSNISADPKREWFRKYTLFNEAHAKSDRIDFLSPFILKGIRERGIEIQGEKAKITACSFTDYTKCRIGEKEPFRIAFAARLEKDKNPVLFVEAAAELAKLYPTVEFLIMGEGRLSGEIQNFLSENTYTNIQFYGFHPNPVEVFAGTSVFVSIQTTNNYPSQSVLEAMACGNAIIATDVGDTRMFISNENGSLIPLQKESLVKAMKYYIDHPDVARSKGLWASDYVRREFTVEKAATYYSNLFREAIRT